MTDEIGPLARKLMEHSNETATGMIVDAALAARIVSAAPYSEHKIETFCGFRLIENPLMPPDQIALVDDAGTILNVIRLNDSQEMPADER